MTHPLRFSFTREILMVVPSTPLRREVDALHQCPLGVGSKLPLPLYADVRLHIPMTHHNDAGRGKHEPSDCETEGSACTASIGCILRYLEELVSILAEGRAQVKAGLSAAGRSGRRSRSPRGSGRSTPTSPSPPSAPSSPKPGGDQSGQLCALQI